MMQSLRTTMMKANLDPTKRLVMFGLYFNMDDKGCCYSSIDELIKETGLAKMEVENNLRELMKDKWIRYREGGTESRNVYQMNLRRMGLRLEAPRKYKEDLFLYGQRFYSETELIANLIKKNQLELYETITKKALPAHLKQQL